MTRHNNTIKPATLKVKAAPPYLNILDVQLNILAVTMRAFGRHVQQPQLSDEAWVETANRYSTAITRQYQLASGTVPPSGFTSLHAYWLACCRAFHESVALAFDAANTVSNSTEAWQHAVKQVRIAWRWWVALRTRVSRLLDAQNALRGFEDAQLVA